MSDTEAGTIKAMQSRARILSKEIADKQAALTLLNAEIEKRIKDAKVIISDHAIVRFLERVRRINMDDVRKEMAPALVREQIASLGSGCFPVEGGKFQLRAKKHVIVTVICNEGDKE